MVNAEKFIVINLQLFTRFGYICLKRITMDEDRDILDFEKSDQQVNPDYYTADGGKRFLNFILDRVGLYLLIFGIGFLIDSSFMNEEVMVVSTLLILPGYWIFTEYFWGKSPAKFITQTTVVTLSGRRPSFLNIVGRTLCRLIPFEAFSFLGSRAVGWHDTISSTRVVNDIYFKDKVADNFV